MAILKDAPRVSYEAGNSVRIIQRHYDKVVTESQGTMWFSIAPNVAANLIQMPALNNVHVRGRKVDNRQRHGMKRA